MSQCFNLNCFFLLIFLNIVAFFSSLLTELHLLKIFQHASVNRKLSQFIFMWIHVFLPLFLSDNLAKCTILTALPVLFSDTVFTDENIAHHSVFLSFLCFLFRFSVWFLNYSFITMCFDVDLKKNQPAQISVFFFDIKVYFLLWFWKIQSFHL